MEREYTCHFRQLGLKLGFPRAAASGVVKTYSDGVLGSGVGHPDGRGSSGSVFRGKELKTALRAGGMRNDDIWGVLRWGFGGGVSIAWVIDEVVGGLSRMTNLVMVDHSVR